MRAFIQQRERVLAILLAWSIYAMWATLASLHGGGPVLDPDDPMRLTEVRDLLNGQSWYDTTQWRMNTPFGLPMHWSRLIDAGIAAVYLVFRCVLDPKAAEIGTLYVWPMLPLLGLLAALDRLARQLGGERAALYALILTLTCVELWHDYQPGDLDHQGVQLALMAWMVVFLIDSTILVRRAAYAALTGIGSLTIGLETLPYVAIGVASLTALCVWQGEKWKRQAQYFSLTFGTAGAASLLFIVASRYRFSPACDTYSFIYGAVAIAGGTGLFAIASCTEKLHNLSRRTWAVTALIAGVVGIAFSIDASCLRGPYAEVDPRLNSIWLSRVWEAQSALAFARLAPSEFIFSYVYALFGLAACIVLMATEKGPRLAYRLLCAFSVIGVIVASVQIRAVPFAIVTSLPAIACLASSVFRLSRLKGVAAPLIGGMAVTLSSGTAFAIVGGNIIERGEHEAARVKAVELASDCGTPRAMQALSRLPKGRVAAFVDQGPAILAYTAHSVIAGPYHRNAAGILDDYAIFAGPERSAKAVLKRRGIDYLMVCRASADWNFYFEHGARDALIRRVSVHTLPRWLQSTGKERAGNVQLYIVDKARLY
jgi:hypothetical protein